MTMKRYRLILLLLSIAALVTTMAPVSFASAKTKTKKMKTYNCIKSGKTVYCTNGNRIFKVNLKTKKVKKLVKGKYGYPSYLKKKGKYLYYCDVSQGLESYIYRINTKNNKKKILAHPIYPAYAISGKKIYYKAVFVKDNGYGDVHYKNKVIKLNGKSKQNTKWKVSMKNKKTNKKGYYVTDNWDGQSWDPVTYYLQTPKGRIKLERTDGPII